MPAPERAGTGRPPDLSRVRRALVIRHRAGGDLLLTTPALRALRAGIPSASIEVLTARGMGDLLAGNPDVDRVIEFDRRSPRSQISLYARLIAGGYDLVLDLVSNPRSAIMAALTHAPIRAGYDIRGRRHAYTLRVPREMRSGDGVVRRYAPEAALDVIRAIGLTPRGSHLTLRVDPSAQSSMDGWLKRHGLGARALVACLPSGSWESKTWLPERFASVMDGLAGDADILWLWGPGEERAATECRSKMAGRSVLAPATGWQELAALLARSALLVSNDSGPKHVAVALGTPTVTVYGPTHPATWHPPQGPHEAVLARGLECLHCDETRCPLPGERHMRCMRDVASDTVLASCRARLKEAAGRVACGSR